GWGHARLSAPGGPNARALCAAGWAALVPQWRPGALSARWQAGVRGPDGCPGEGARLSHRAGGGGERAAGAGGGARGGGAGARGRAGRGAAGSLPGGDGGRGPDGERVAPGTAGPAAGVYAAGG